MLVKRPNLRNFLVSHLFNAVLQGILPPGSRIIEGKLARELGVAQGTLREALQELEHQGLVRRFERRGTFVTKLTLKDVEDIYVVRLALEPLAAFLALPYIQPEDLKQLIEMLDSMRRAAGERDFVNM
jgi:DNA-binding GntR family transcriptional regulator